MTLQNLLYLYLAVWAGTIILLSASGFKVFDWIQKPYQHYNGNALCVCICSCLTAGMAFMTPTFHGFILELFSLEVIAAAGYLILSIMLLAGGLIKRIPLWRTVGALIPVITSGFSLWLVLALYELV